MEEADQLCDRLAIIDSGAIVADGSAEQLKAQMGHDVTGYDISPAMLKLASAKAAQADVPAAFAVGDAYDLPLADGSVDVVVNRLVLWTLHDPSAALREWWRVLSAGGRIVVTDGLWWATPAKVGLGRKAWRQTQRLLRTCRSRRRAGRRRWRDGVLSARRLDEARSESMSEPTGRRPACSDPRETRSSSTAP